MTNIIKEFMDMKPGAKFLENVGRVANALERIADHMDAIRADHQRGIDAKYGKEKLPDTKEKEP